jgi:hypothetical protein
MDNYPLEVIRKKRSERQRRRTTLLVTVLAVIVTSLLLSCTNTELVQDMAQGYPSDTALVIVPPEQFESMGGSDVHLFDFLPPPQHSL